LHDAATWSVLFDDKQREVGNNIEYHDKYLEQADEAVDNHVEGIPWNQIPHAVHPVHPITGIRGDQE
jgi:hypothetical protein